MGRVVHFELPADDPERAARFYTEAFGWTVAKWDGPSEYWGVTTGPDEEPGISGGLMRRQEGMSGPLNYVGVDSVDDAVARVTAAGGQVAFPKTAIPTVGWWAVVLDTEGNPVAVMEEDAGAA